MKVNDWEEAILQNPAFTRAYNQLGLLYFSEFKFSEAIETFRRGISVDPAIAELHLNLGNALKAAGRLNEAAISYKTCLCLDKNQYSALGNLGAVFKHLGDFDQAEKCLLKSLTGNPNSSIANYNLGIVYQEKWQFEKALSCFDQAIKLNPQFIEPIRNKYLVARQLCDFHLTKDLEPTLEKSLADDPFISIIRSESFKKNLVVAKNWSKLISAGLPKITFNYHNKEKSQKIRVGYISNDFREHPIGRMTAPLFRYHDHKKFEVFAYSYGANDSSIARQNAIDHADHFIDLRDLGIVEAAKKINSDSIDILVDLTGYTENHRLEIMAMRPARIQMTWLGFPGTTGAEFIDYLIADPIIIPSDAQKYFSEKIIYLPNCYQINDHAPLESTATYHRKDFGLPENAFIFCSFNQSYKIDAEIWQTWMQILKRTPNSLLCLWEQCPDASVNLKTSAVTLGIDTNRLIFMPSLPKIPHLARVALCDLGLDTRVYGGHTTTTDCLRMGVPVITKIGNHFASRVCASLLSSVNLNNLIVNSLSEYEVLAVNLASDPKKYQEIKQSININQVLFNPKNLITHLESAYENCLR